MILTILIFLISPVDQLRERTSFHLAQMNAVIAEQRLLRSGQDGLKYERRLGVGLYEQQQFFRVGNETTDEIHPLNNGVTPGWQWLQLAALLSYGLAYSGETPNGHSFKYSASCPFTEYQTRLWDLGKSTRKGFLPCHGLVFTDRDFNVYKVTQEMIATKPWQIRELSSWVEFEWRNVHGRKLLPSRAMTIVVFANGATYYAESEWNNYRVFASGEPTVIDDIEETKPPYHLQLMSPRLRSASSSALMRCEFALTASSVACASAST